MIYLVICEFSSVREKALFSNLKEQGLFEYQVFQNVLGPLVIF